MIRVVGEEERRTAMVNRDSMNDHLPTDNNDKTPSTVSLILPWDLLMTTPDPATAVFFTVALLTKTDALSSSGFNNDREVDPSSVKCVVGDRMAPTWQRWH